jgi:hypothetical protein
VRTSPARAIGRRGTNLRRPRSVAPSAGRTLGQDPARPLPNARARSTLRAR